jgi:YggT family protein
MNLICWLIGVYIVVVLVRIVLSWFPISYGSPMVPVARALAAVTDPILEPMRRAIPPVRLGAMAMDLSPLILILGLSILQGIIC